VFWLEVLLKMRRTKEVECVLLRMNYSIMKPALFAHQRSVTECNSLELNTVM